MKPKPFWLLNHFAAPVGIGTSLNIAIGCLTQNDANECRHKIKSRYVRESAFSHLAYATADHNVAGDTKLQPFD